jgi:hypothetical protein
MARFLLNLERRNLHTRIADVVNAHHMMQVDKNKRQSMTIKASRA